jgi:hypothetical protein
MLRARRIAVVGASDDPNKPSHSVIQYLIRIGLDVVPINPNHRQVLGRACYASLTDAPGRIDLVDVFRRAEHCPQVVREAIARAAGGVWLQSGIVSEPARELAAAAGIDFVQNRCLMVEHRRHRREPAGG